MTSIEAPDPTRVARRLSTAFVASVALLLSALFAIATPSTSGAVESSSTQVDTAKPVILILGDSISAEYGLQRDSGWVKLLEGRLREQHYDYPIVNASISGETTSGGRARIDELIGRLKPAIVIVELGGNDALRGLALATTQENLAAIVTTSQKAHASVLLIGMQVPPNYGKAFADRFAAIYSETAKRYKTALTPFFFAGFADRFDLFQADRIHPTAEAQIRLLDNVWPNLQPILKQQPNRRG
jgi:acyl-CoA thioesterase-1